MADVNMPYYMKTFCELIYMYCTVALCVIDLYDTAEAVL